MRMTNNPVPELLRMGVEEKRMDSSPRLVEDEMTKF
jgi:hypothetical protein